MLMGLNVTNPAAAHCEILSRSVFGPSAASNGLCTIMKRLVSSANSRLLEPISGTMSLIYNKKK